MIVNLPSVLVVLLYFRFNSASYTNTTTVNCTIYRDSLAKALSDFTACSITYSRPVKFCESCVNMFINVVDSYHNLSVFQDDKDYCINNYIHLDRLEILLNLYENSYNLWYRGKCNECFEVSDGKLTNQTSKEMNKFDELYSNLGKCMNNKELNTTSICKTCTDDYTTLNDYYRSISNENERIDICMDIVDLMNSTRSFWSTNCCKFRHKDEAVFITSTILFIIIVPLFYVLTKFCAEKKIPIILKQSRFGGSFNRRD